MMCADTFIVLTWCEYCLFKAASLHVSPGVQLPGTLLAEAMRAALRLDFAQIILHLQDVKASLQVMLSSLLDRGRKGCLIQWCCIGWPYTVRAPFSHRHRDALGIWGFQISFPPVVHHLGCMHSGWIHNMLCTCVADICGNLSHLLDLWKRIWLI